MLQLMTRYADYWTAFNVSSLETYRPMRDAVDAACLDAGRDPMTLARTVTVAIDLPGLEARIDPTSWVRRFRTALRGPFSGSTEAIVGHLRSLAQAGLSHVQVWLDPLSLEGIDAFVPVLEALDRA